MANRFFTLTQPDEDQEAPGPDKPTRISQIDFSRFRGDRPARLERPESPLGPVIETSGALADAITSGRFAVRGDQPGGQARRDRERFAAQQASTAVGGGRLIRPRRQGQDLPVAESTGQFLANRLERGLQILRAGAANAAQAFIELNAGAPSPRMRFGIVTERATAEISEDREALEAIAQRSEEAKQRAIRAAQDLGRLQPENFVQEVLGYVVEMAPVGLGAVVGSAAGTIATGSPIGGAMIGAASVAYPTEQAFLEEELRQEGVNDADARFFAGLGAIPIAAAELAFEATAAGKAGERLVGEQVKRTIAQRLSRIAKSAALGGPTEGSTEALQELIGMEVVAQITGDRPTGEETVARLGQAFKAGFFGGAGFAVGIEAGAQFGAAAKSAHNRAVEEARQAERRAALVNFDADAVEPGTTIGNKTAKRGKDGRIRWFDQQGNFASKPTQDEVAVELGLARESAQDAQEVNDATVEGKPVDVAPRQAVVEIMALDDVETQLDPEVVELSARSAAADYLGNAIQDVQRRFTPDEIDAKRADLEYIALAPDSGATFHERVAALGARMALDSAVARSREGGSLIDETRLAKKLAQTDDDVWRSNVERIEADGRPEEQRVLQQARAFREAGGQLLRERGEVDKLLSEARARRSRGLSRGSRVALPDGQVATVVDRRTSGFVDLEMPDGSGAVMSPADLVLMPVEGRTVELFGGEVAEVLEVVENSAKVRKPDGTEAVIDLSDIESLSTSPAQRAAQATKLRQQQEQAAAAQVEQTNAIGQTLVAVDRETGEQVDVVGVGPTTFQLDDGRVVPQDSLFFPDDDAPEVHLLSTVKATGQIPPFRAGTQPSAPGRSINFVQVPEQNIQAMEHALTRPETTLKSVLEAAKGRFSILPLPHKPGTRTYAVEAPSGGRNLTDAARRLVSFISGNSNKVPTRPGLTAGFKFKDALGADETGIYEVPEALLMPVNPTPVLQNARSMPTAEGREVVRNYLRRLADLGFETSAPVAEKAREAAKVGEEAQRARLTGRTGEAELLEIAWPLRRAEIYEQARTEELEAQRALWDVAIDELRTVMAPEEISLTDALNASLVDDLVKLPGIGQRLAEKIVEHRDSQGGQFEKVEDLLKVPGIGEAKLSEDFREALRQGIVSMRDRINAQRHEALRNYLDLMPPRQPGRIGYPVLAFEHPQIPGLVLVLDKERIPTVVRRRPEITDAEIDQARVLVGEGIFGGVDSHSALEMGNIVEDALADGNLNIRSEVRSSLLGDPRIGGQIRNESVDMADFEEFVDKATSVIQSVRDRILSQGTRQQGERDVFHIQVITPEGDQIQMRTIGHSEGSFEVPISKMRAREGAGGFTDTPEAIQRINQAEARGMTRAEAVEEMMDELGETRIVTIKGQTEEVAILEDGTQRRLADLTEDAASQAQRITERPLKFEVISEEGQTVVVSQQGSSETFEIPVDQIADEVGTTTERTVRVPVPTRLTREEVLDETMRALRGFKTKARTISVGEWRGPFEGTYATVRQQPDGLWRAEVMQEPLTETPSTVRLYDVDAVRLFPSQEEAAAWLEGEMGFTRHADNINLLANFESLPPVSEVRRQDLEDVEARLTRVMGLFNNYGYTPQPVRDYAVRFVQKWQDAGKNIEHLYTPFQRSRLKTFTTRDLVRQAGRDDPKGPIHGLLLSDAETAFSPAQIAHAKETFESVEQQDRFVDLHQYDGEELMANVRERLVRVGNEEKRLGIVVGSRPGSDTVTVQTWRGGQPVIRTVHKRDVERVRDPRKALDWFRAAKDSMGELSNVPITPEMGASPYDAEMGLDLVDTREAYVEGLKSYVAPIIKKIAVAEDGNITGDATLARELVPAWIRMKEMEISNREVEIPQQLVMTLQELAREEIQGQFSNVSPYGRLMARIKLGLNTNKTTRDRIASQAEQFGADPDLPLYRKVEFLMQNVWNPEVADYLFQLRRDIGALGFLRDSDFPEHGVEISLPAVGSVVQSNLAASRFMFTREFGYRHPTGRMFHFMAEKARTAYGNTVKQGSDIIKALQGHGTGMNLQKKNEVWSLLTNETLGDLQDGPAGILTQREIEDALGDEVPSWDGWYKQYSTLRRIFVQGRRMNIRNALVRGMHPVDADLTSDDPNTVDTAVQILKKDYGLTAEEIRELRESAEAGQPFQILDRNSDSRYARPREEVEAFLTLTDNYRALSEVPDSVRNNMKDWMVKEFDFWSRYGINNYAPRILQGRHVIKLRGQQGQPDRMVAFVPDGQTAQEYFLRVREGDVPGVPPSAVDDLIIEYRKATATDLDMEFQGPKKFSRVYARLVKEGGDEGTSTRLARAAVQELKIGREPASPRDLHMQERISDLSEVIEDPYERALIYWTRTARNNYLLDIEHAYEEARALDGVLSKARGVDTIFTDEGIGSETMKGYMDDLRDSYMGRPTSMEKHVNSLFALMGAPFRLGKAKIGRLVSKMTGNPNYSLWADMDYLDALYNEDYAARRVAQEFTTLQSVWRLGLNLAGSAINSTQHLAFTPAYLVSRGVSVGDALKFSVAGYKDMWNYWRAQHPDEIRRLPKWVASHRASDIELREFAQEVGISTTPARGIAGPGLGIGGEGAPLFFSDDSLLTRAEKTIEWLAMMPFAKAERSVRLAGSFAARRAAIQRGLDDGSAVAFARDVIDNTQFQYYDQALPPFMRGPGMRVLLQFQQFPANALKFEKDLLLGSFGGRGFRGSDAVLSADGTALSAKAQARKAWLLYNVAGMLAGGAAWQVARPAFSPFAWLAHILKLIGTDDLEEKLMVEAVERSRRNWIEEQIDRQMREPIFGSARNMVLYGLPGLIDLQISGRLGVSGLSIDGSRFADLAAGPTGSIFAESYNVLFGEGGYMTVNPSGTVGGLGLGGLARLARGRGAHAMTGLALGMAGVSIVSAVGDKPSFGQFVRDTQKGRRFIRSIAPTLARGISETIDIFGDPDADVTDANFVTRRYPGGVNMAFEASSSLIGFQTIREAEERAYTQYLLQSADKARILRRAYVEVAASVAEDHALNSEEVLQVIDLANERDHVLLTIEDVREELERRKQSPLARAKRRLPKFLELGGGL